MSDLFILFLGFSLAENDACRLWHRCGGNHLEKEKKTCESATSLFNRVRHVGEKEHPEMKGGMTRRPGRSERSLWSSLEDFETALLCFRVLPFFWVEIV